MPLNRVINNPDHVVEDMLAGWLLAHADTVAATDNPRVLRRRAAPQAGKVGVVTGGGSGHEPAFLGYLGDGLLDAVAIGEIFSSPTARSFMDAIRAADGGAGVACLYGNYAGDNMNVQLATRMAEREGITVQTVVANDDVASAPRGDEGRRRGVAGEILMWKVGAAKAAQGGSLAEVIAAARKAIEHTRSVGIGLSACVIPAVGKANFTIEAGSMEMGIGHHGEPGVAVCATASAAQMAQQMLDMVLPDLPFGAGDRVAVLVSGLGATPLMEQYILYAEVARRLQAAGITVAFNRVGNLFTSLEMMGVTLTLMKLDDELQACLGAPCQSVGLALRPSGSAPYPSAGFAPQPSAALAPHPPAGLPVAGAAMRQQAGLAAATGPAARPQPGIARSVQGPALDMARCGALVRELIDTICAHRQYLSEIDGLIGDGDHGINMSKGFAGCGERLDRLGEAEALQLPKALEQLSQALMDDIGGSMGPLYGRFFMGFVSTLEHHAQLDAALFGQALAAAVANVQAMGNAQPGDKTLIDTLVPACAAYRQALEEGRDFAQALDAMRDAAEAGKESTRALQARVGRSARLGARSIGVLDAGASSCFLILQSMARSLQRQLSA